MYTHTGRNVCPMVYHQVGATAAAASIATRMPLTEVVHGKPRRASVTMTTDDEHTRITKLALRERTLIVVVTRRQPVFVHYYYYLCHRRRWMPL